MADSSFRCPEFFRKLNIQNALFEIFSLNILITWKKYILHLINSNFELIYIHLFVRMIE